VGTVDTDLANHLAEVEAYEAGQDRIDELAEELYEAAVQGNWMDELTEWAADEGLDLLSRLREEIERVRVWIDPREDVERILLHEWRVLCRLWARDEAERVAKEVEEHNEQI